MYLLYIPIDIHKNIIAKYLDKNSLYSYSRSCLFLFKLFKALRFGKKFALEHSQFNLIDYFKSPEILIVKENTKFIILK